MRGLLARARADEFHPELRTWARVLPRNTVNERNLRFFRRLGDRAPFSPAFETVEVGPTVSVRLYRPPSAPARAGALLWMHGGGLVVGNARELEPFFRRLADGLGIVFASVEYRLAPEHRYPAALDDAYAALTWLASRDDVDPTRIAVGGGSAGGNLAAATALATRDRGGPPLATQVLIYPMLDDRTAGRRDHAPHVRRLCSQRFVDFAWRGYLGPEPREVDHLAAPARCTDLTGVAPAWIGVGTLDLFHDESLAYARALEVAGVEVRTEVVPGAYHGFDLADRLPVSRAFRASWADALREAIG